MLRFDVRAGSTAGTSGELAVQVGPEGSWCQGGRWAWTAAGTSRTITESFDEIECPAGVELDLTRIHAVWVFLNGGDTPTTSTTSAPSKRSPVPDVP